MDSLFDNVIEAWMCGNGIDILLLFLVHKITISRFKFLKYEGVALH